MKNSVTPSVLALLLISLSGCASYSPIAPEWAQIGAENRRRRKWIPRLNPMQMRTAALGEPTVLVLNASRQAALRLIILYL